MRPATVPINRKAKVAFVILVAVICYSFYHMKQGYELEVANAKAASRARIVELIRLNTFANDQLAKLKAEKLKLTQDVANLVKETQAKECSGVKLQSHAALQASGVERPRVVYGMMNSLMLTEGGHVLYGAPPSLVVDVGAYVGDVSRGALRLGYRLISIEPFEKNIAQLKKNLKPWMENVTIYEGAASNHSGYITMFAPKSAANRNGGADATVSAEYGGGPPLKIKSYALDDIIDEHVYFLKIDVQGHEHKVLQGAKKLFEKHGVDYVYIEFTGFEGVEVFDFLHNHGFTCYDTAWTEVKPKEELFSYKGMPGVLVEETDSSVGQHFRQMFIRNRPGQIEDFVELLLNNAFQTDLWCVHERNLHTITFDHAKPKGKE
eukprot:TRINITY_DN31268_c0_g1_i1.p1 TRINITY_DN31268_c0_g1~~TRINITY_DN31268_c0_g1_i1.p1  ORF type:complete len:410 (+),score=112.39 TRINITY_DN31268_c0_g1_i1:98-1231(+)